MRRGVDARGASRDGVETGLHLAGAPIRESVQSSAPNADLCLTRPQRSATSFVADSSTILRAAARVATKVIRVG